MSSMSSTDTEKVPFDVPSPLSIAQGRIKNLAKSHFPLDVSKLPLLYESEYHEKLNYKELGCSKLKELIDMIPCVDFYMPAELSPFYVVPHGEKPPSSEQTLKPKPTPSLYSEQDSSWLQPAIDLWVERALSAITNANQGNLNSELPIEQFEFRLANEASRNNKKLRPNDIPDAKQYIKKVIKGLRQDPRLRWEKRDIGIVYWSSGGSAAAVDDDSDVASKNQAASSQNTILSISQERVTHSAEKNYTSSSNMPLDDADDRDNAGMKEDGVPPLFHSFYSLATKIDSDDHHLVNPRFLEADQAQQHTPRTIMKPGPEGTSHLQRVSLGDQSAASSFKEMSLLGHLTANDAVSNGEPVFLNTNEPFCLTTIGVQGAGKSHTLACVLESCLMSCKVDAEVIRLQKPMTALVLHYDQSTTSVCEAAGLLSPSLNNPEGPLRSTRQSCHYCVADILQAKKGVLR